MKDSSNLGHKPLELWRDGVVGLKRFIFGHPGVAIKLWAQPPLLTKVREPL